MQNGQGAAPLVQAPMGDRRPIGGGPTEELPVQSTPPSLYAAPVPPAQPAAQVPAQPQAAPPPGAPPWAKKPEVQPLVLPQQVEFGIQEGLRYGATAEQLLQYYGEHITYAQLVEYADKHGFEIKRDAQLAPTPAPASAPAPTSTTSTSAAPTPAPAQARDRIQKDKHYPLIVNYLAKGVEDVAHIARELNVTEKAVTKAIAAIKKDPAKWGWTQPQASAPPAQQTLPEIAASAQPTPIIEWVPQIGQVVPGTASDLPSKEICDRIHAAGLDIEWRREEKDGYVIIPGPAMRAAHSELGAVVKTETAESVSSAGAVTSRFDASAPNISNVSVFNVGDSPMINRSLEILCAVHELARNAGYSFDEISGAAELLAASNASA